MRVTIRQLASESFNNSNHLQGIFPGRDFEWMKEKIVAAVETCGSCLNIKINKFDDTTFSLPNIIMNTPFRWWHYCPVRREMILGDFPLLHVRAFLGSIKGCSENKSYCALCAKENFFLNTFSIFDRERKMCP